VTRTAAVPYDGRALFRLGDDVESYPQFVPWCNAAPVASRSGNSVVATLELHKRPISKHFTTRNTRRDFEAIDMELVGGPFRQLSGGWRFRDIEDQGCRVSLELGFECESRLVDLMFGAFCMGAGDSLAHAFHQRAWY